MKLIITILLVCVAPENFLEQNSKIFFQALFFFN